MASSINSTSTGNGGLVSTGDDSGILNIQTNETTAITVDASQRVAFVAGTAALPAITTTGDTNTGIFFPAADTIAFSEGGAESMRIDASGNVLIATTNAITGITGVQLTASNTSENPAYINIFRDDTTIGNGQFLGYLQFCGRDATSSLGTGHAYVGAVAEADHGAGDNATAITFGTTPDNSSSMAERMRITSGGYLKASNNGSYVGVSDEGHELRGTTGSVILRVNANNASYTSVVTSLECTRNTSNNTYYFIQATRVGQADVFRVADSGNCTNTNGSYGTISDVKLKENIVDATPKLDKVNQLQVRNYNFIGDDLKQIGFVAQEFEQVFPSMVEESSDKDKDGNDLGTTTKTIKTTVLIPVLVKAIQELKAINDTQAETINALTARIVALEQA